MVLVAWAYYKFFYVSEESGYAFLEEAHSLPPEEAAELVGKRIRLTHLFINKIDTLESTNINIPPFQLSLYPFAIIDSDTVQSCYSANMTFTSEDNDLRLQNQTNDTYWPCSKINGNPSELLIDVSNGSMLDGLNPRIEVSDYMKVINGQFLESDTMNMNRIRFFGYNIKDSAAYYSWEPKMIYEREYSLLRMGIPAVERSRNSPYDGRSSEHAEHLLEKERKFFAARLAVTDVDDATKESIKKLLGREPNLDELRNYIESQKLRERQINRDIYNKDGDFSSIYTYKGKEPYYYQFGGYGGCLVAANPYFSDKKGVVLDKDDNWEATVDGWFSKPVFATWADMTVIITEVEEKEEHMAVSNLGKLKRETLVPSKRILRAELISVDRVVQVESKYTKLKDQVQRIVNGTIPEKDSAQYIMPLLSKEHWFSSVWPKYEKLVDPWAGSYTGYLENADGSLDSSFVIAFDAHEYATDSLEYTAQVNISRTDWTTSPYTYRATLNRTEGPRQYRIDTPEGQVKFMIEWTPGPGVSELTIEGQTGMTNNSYGIWAGGAKGSGPFIQHLRFRMTRTQDRYVELFSRSYVFPRNPKFQELERTVVD